jgi:hypothetical protein
MTTINLTRQEFEVAFQVSHQAANFQESRLSKLGVSLAELDALLSLLGSVRNRVAGAVDIQIRFRSDGDADLGIDGHGTGSAGSPEDVIVVSVPRSWETRWRSILELAQSGLSEREMFLRTGYGREEVEEAVRKF